MLRRLVSRVGSRVVVVGVVAVFALKVAVGLAFAARPRLTVG